MITKTLLLPASVAVVTAHVLAQTPSSRVAFEVASVKRNTAGDDRPTLGGIQPGGRVLLWNIPLRTLIRNAYQMQDRQVVGAPSWTSAERFDIEAKAPGNLPSPRPGAGAGTVQLMMRTLLAERFHLVVHEESRELSAYVLELARSDGSTGPQLRASNIDCTAIAAERQQIPVLVIDHVERPTED